MFRIIMIFGGAAGLVVAVPLFVLLATGNSGSSDKSQIVSYLIMILALSLVFVGTKRFRDREGGGAIKFVPALLVGLGISAVASVIYVIGWEITLAATHYAFADAYSAAMVGAERAKGASPEQIAQVAAQMEAFKAQYANPLFRLPTTFIEIFPVGVLISLISAGLLRNSRFLPAAYRGHR
jgi:hypothetical protein